MRPSKSLPRPGAYSSEHQPSLPPQRVEPQRMDPIDLGRAHPRSGVGFGKSRCRLVIVIVASAAPSFRALGDPLIAAQEGDPSSQKVNPRLQSLGPHKPKRRVADPKGLARELSPSTSSNAASQLHSSLMKRLAIHRSERR